MNLKEYEQIKNLNYDEYCQYLQNKYGLSDGNYFKTGNKRSDEGIFLHHIAENKVASLSNPEVAISVDPMKILYQEPKDLCFCDYLEHMLLHILIGKETAATTNLGLHGDNLYIIPALRSFFEEEEKINKYNDAYYEKVKDDRDVYDILFKRYNDLVEQIDVVLDTNEVLYLEAEKYLDEKGKALVVLGTGLGKTSTALQYLWKHQCRALVVGPNLLIKTGWEKYGEWVDVTTYQSLANEYEKIDYSKYSLIIIDEAHHAGYDVESNTGAAIWSKGIEYILSKGYKVLGLTATPERSDGIDISETLFKGCVCEGRSVEDAIEDGTIHPFSYVTAIYDTRGIIEEVRDIYDDGSEECKQLIGQLDLQLNDLPTVREIFSKYDSYMSKSKRKGIVFIQEIQDKEPAIKILKDIFPDLEFRAIDSKMDVKEVEENRKWFENTDEGYLLAVNMISEGAHYKGVNTLIMFRRTSSYLVFTQQLGRIITLAKDENPNAIVFDLVNNVENIRYNDRKINKKKKKVSDVIKALRKKIDAIKSGQIIIADETRDIVKTIRKIKEYADSSWQEWEDEILKTYYETEGPQSCMERINAEWERRFKDGETNS